jgi:hypothetical protein
LRAGVFFDAGRVTFRTGAVARDAVFLLGAEPDCGGLDAVTAQ